MTITIGIQPPSCPGPTPRAPRRARDRALRLAHLLALTLAALISGLAVTGCGDNLDECGIVICGEAATFFDQHVTYGMFSALEAIGMTYKSRCRIGVTSGPAVSTGGWMIFAGW